ncbi:MAG TPA: tripartite tricarboxylate transporter substrate binding protein [Burkholderiales bacterium]|nr:tripartite tricarboxylate transporter substrate binding protein [Burkholderiales bacterium]
MRNPLPGALCALALASALGPVAAAAADYPVRPIRIVVPQSPGASTDLTARLIGQKLGESWKQSVIVDNRPGASGIAGSEIVARAVPDGYTLMVIASSFSINPALRPSLPYDPVRDFTPVSQLSKFPNMLAVNPSVPVKTLQDVIALARAKPGQLNYASAGTGTGTHMSAELLKQATGINIVHIPYKGGGPATVATMGGQTQLIFGTSVGLLPHVRAGKLRAIALTSAKRSAAAPDIPTFAESGVPGYEHEPWNGMFAPARMPKAVLAKLNAEVVRIMHTAEVAKVLEHEGAEPVGGTPEEFAVIIKAETAKWAKLVKAAGIKSE